MAAQPGWWSRKVWILVLFPALAAVLWPLPAQEARRPAKSFTGPAGVKLVAVPGGKFWMGSSGEEIKAVQRRLPGDPGRQLW
jgi:hypothetical protein